jgi:hypothetical protein
LRFEVQDVDQTLVSVKFSDRTPMPLVAKIESRAMLAMPATLRLVSGSAGQPVRVA